MSRKYFSFFLFFIQLASCLSPTNKIPLQDKRLIPYKGFETLVFENNKADFDTIFLQGYIDFTSPVNQWSFPLKYIEHYILLSKRSDPNYNRYLDSLRFVTLTNGETTKIKIDLTVKHSWFFGKTYSKSEFLHLRDTTLRIDNIVLKDVLIIKGNPDKSDRKTILVIYWSKALGLVKYTNSDGESWHLVKLIK